ncbi:hypothetical protein SPRG_10875 [Saprolegnia parasitica CBS 223.65]|uniref:Uncharacterized protein n=1 Tax=Saprolegnia parasitica (strain CBS 223.65) TaxID=695850 RepID=A0A067C0N7_SAPPC|nr:hypothetical protein SPRG_10875 [Saprolegnia parasitica CBS 223.65]KDO24088.1 hypothetical protein SPRG_10875 [Saprolegnia parasitica CBS 223.65]|eukprot:XP_012205224.1 hypothetical protein SPRG_10875 [Saprolegnia parasitica CBS 223.65]
MQTPAMYAPDMIVVQCDLLIQSTTPIARNCVELDAHAHGALVSFPEDNDAYTGVLTPSIGELLQPFHIASNELQQFFTPLTLAALTQHVGHALNLCHVMPGNVQAPVVVQLCEVWLLATIEMQYATGTLRLQVSSGDANLGDTLFDALVDATSSAH